MPGFQSPNHTQVPNELFDDHMMNMDKSELKVVLCIIRQTLGWHRERTRYSIGNISRVTGLSRSNVLVGAENAERRGLIRRIPNTIPAEWELVWENETPPIAGGITTGPLLQQEVPPPTIGGLPLLQQEGLKERKKELKKKEEVASFSSFETSQAIERFNDNHARSAEKLYQQVTGQISIPAMSMSQALTDLETLLDHYGKNWDRAVSEGKDIFSGWCNTTGKSGKNYSPTNTGWLSKWLERIAPRPEAQDTTVSSIAERMEALARAAQKAR